ncbi:hypothetical protein [Selenomonas artemidis]|uniref:hypothetical protein n=1 Tax=Selenomonas artemidis TaxID=671224 RepID=UPI0023F28721|nr:hypothetical protein [Selenomonas artemidis]
MIESRKPTVTFKGDGSTTVFPFSFALNAASDLHVSVYDTAAGTATDLSRDYYVDVAGKAVHYPGYAPGQEPAEHERPPALPAGKSITLYRRTVVDQQVDLGEKYPLPYIETMVDKTTAILQEMEAQIERSVKVTLGDPKNPSTLIQSLYERAAIAEQAATDARESENAATTAANSALNSKEVAEGLAARMDEVFNKAFFVAEAKLRSRLSIEFLLKSLFDGHIEDALAHAPAFSAHNKDENAHPNLGLHIRKNSTTYAVGDIAYSRSLPSWARLECVKAGTTGASILNLAEVRKCGVMVTDGNAVWIVDDVRDGARVGDIILRPTLRDGYIKANGSTVKASEYPRLLAWVQEAGMTVTAGQYAQDCSKYVYDAAQDKLTLPNMTGRVLQGGETVKSVEAGLPQHTHKLNGWVGTSAQKEINSGGFSVVDVATSDTSAGANNPIYGRSDTVQPPALHLIAQIKY